MGDSPQAVFSVQRPTVRYRPSFSHCGRPGSTAVNFFARANWEISKDRASGTYSTGFAQNRATLARESVVAVANQRMSVAKSGGAKRSSELRASERFVRKSPKSFIDGPTHTNR